MSANEDKYPVESDRRRFVKGVVGAGAIAGIGSSGLAAINTATPPTGSGGGITPFMGIERTGGPAPRGMPQIPIEIDDNGNIIGRWPEVFQEQVQGQTVTRAEEEIAGITYSAQWFQYCGVQTSPALVPDSGRNNQFLSSSTSQYEWQNSQLESGDPLKLEHFEDYQEWGNGIGEAGVGKPAAATWRSEGLDSAAQLNVIVIRSPLIEEAAQNDEWLSATTSQGVFAYLNVCTHFCCIPGYKTSETSERVGIADGVLCQCHQSQYDPFTILEQQFISFPRPEDSGESSGGSESGESDRDSGGSSNESGSNRSGGGSSGGGNESGGGNSTESSDGGNESGGANTSSGGEQGGTGGGG